MKKKKKIEEIETAVLLSLYSKVKYSKHAHPMKETILKGLRKDLRGLGKVALDNLVKKRIYHSASNLRRNDI